MDDSPSGGYKTLQTMSIGTALRKGCHWSLTESIKSPDIVSKASCLLPKGVFIQATVREAVHCSSVSSIHSYRNNSKIHVRDPGMVIQGLPNAIDLVPL